MASSQRRYQAQTGEQGKDIGEKLQQNGGGAESRFCIAHAQSITSKEGAGPDQTLGFGWGKFLL